MVRIALGEGGGLAKLYVFLKGPKGLLEIIFSLKIPSSPLSRAYVIFLMRGARFVRAMIAAHPK